MLGRAADCADPPARSIEPRELARAGSGFSIDERAAADGIRCIENAGDGDAAGDRNGLASELQPGGVEPSRQQRAIVADEEQNPGSA